MWLAQPRGGLGRAPGQDSSLGMLLLPRVLAVKGVNGVTPARGPTAETTPTPTYPNTHVWHPIPSPHTAQVTSGRLLRNVIRNTMKKKGAKYLVSIKDTLGRNLFLCIYSQIAKGLALWKASKIHSWKSELLLSVF